MASRSSSSSSPTSTGPRNSKQRWCAVQPLTPLMEGPDPEMQDHSSRSLLVGGGGDNNYYYKENTSSNWEAIREWFRHQKATDSPESSSDGISPPSVLNGSGRKQGKQGAKNSQDLRLLLGVLGCPLAPIPIPSQNPPPSPEEECNPGGRVHIKDIPMAKSMAHYIIKQYLAATGCLKGEIKRSSMYAAGSVKMIRCETEVSSGKNVKSLGGKSAVEHGCFVLWQMLPSMWSLELAVGIGGDRKSNCNYHHLVAGSDGKTVWRHTPWLGTHAAKGPQRPLRRIIQGLDPKSTGRLFSEAEWVGEQTIGEEECFLLKVSAQRSAVMERSEGPAEVLRHVLYGYFSQKSGLLVYLEDSHLTRVAVSPARAAANDDDDHGNVHEEGSYVYWETTIGSRIGDYREVDGVMIAHEGRSIATVFRFEEQSVEHSRTRMEELWRIDDVVFNVPGLSLDHFIPPADIFVP
ncbi:hypothetical protein LINPERHAP2_LOCUS20538 [Linum perenne]